MNCMRNECKPKPTRLFQFSVNLSLSVRELVKTCSDSCESTAQKERATGEKDQQPSSNSGPTLYHRVIATRATDPGQDLLSPIALCSLSNAMSCSVTLVIVCDKMALHGGLLVLPGPLACRVCEVRSEGAQGGICSVLLHIHWEYL